MGSDGSQLKPWQFKPGQSGNPEGGRKQNPRLKRLRLLTQNELIEIGSVICYSSMEQLKKIMKNPKSRVLQAMIASVAVRTITKGDPSALNVILDRLLGKVKNEIYLEQRSLKEEEARIDFTEFCLRAGYPKPFAKQIEMKNFILNQTGVKMLLGARGYGKTEYITTLGVAYELYLNPRRSFLIMTKSEQRNKAVLREIARACENVGMRFSVKNAEDLFLEGCIGITPSVSAVTILTCSLRGRHPDDVIFDDPVTPESATPAHREKLKIIYDEVVGKVCHNVGLIGQPVHNDDLYANLEKSIPVMRVPFGEIPSLDPDLEAQRAAGVSEESIRRSYFLEQSIAGELPFDKIKYLDKFPTGDTSIAVIDPSFEGGDYTALSIIKAYFDGVAVVGFCFKRAWNHCIEEIADKIKKYNVARLAIETNALGTMPVDALRSALPAVGVIGIKSNTNKHSRIMAAGAFAHLIHLSKESDKIYIDQIVKYEYNVDHDDAPDSLASALAWVGLIRGKV